jgi:hypothetical protein
MDKKCDNIVLEINVLWIKLHNLIKISINLKLKRIGRFNILNNHILDSIKHN